MAPPPDLMTDLVGEILLRLPPDDPASLVRASLVCKPWRRLIADPSFSRRYRAFHQSPPMLGFFNFNDYFRPDGGVPHFISTVSPSPIPQPTFDRGDWYALDSRHGRVLFGSDSRARADLFVWEPITGRRQEVQGPPMVLGHGFYTAAVLCALRSCNHLDCCGGPFLVALAGYDTTGRGLRAHVYSSQAGTWNTPANEYSPLRIGQDRSPSVLIGDYVYFTLLYGDQVLRLDIGKNCLSAIDSPGSRSYGESEVLMLTENGSLGLARVKGLRLCLWSRDVNSDGNAEWLQFRIIELGKLIIAMPHSEATLLGSAEGLGIIFVATQFGVFTIELKSGRVRKVGNIGDYFQVFPFMSFYTPGTALAL
ncbi:hypothetical protein EJB05_14279, partial [Eragrostis curvula]